MAPESRRRRKGLRTFDPVSFSLKVRLELESICYILCKIALKVGIRRKMLRYGSTFRSSS